MKKLYFLLLSLLITSVSVAQTTVFQEDFETDGNGTRYTTSVPEFTDGTGDFFIRTDGSNIASFYEVSGASGSFYFAAMDLDGEGGSTLVRINFDDIDISTYSNLSLLALFAEDDDGTNQDWDADSLVYVEVDVDNSGSFTKIIQFASAGATNTEPSLDTDFDGIGDGAALTNNFAEFSASIPSGSLVDIRITIEGLDAGDEDIALDNIRIDGTLSTNDYNQKSFNVFPNPTNTGSVNVVSASTSNYSPINVAVFDVLGKQVINKTMTSEKLNVSSLNTGVYIMKITQGKATSTKKLVIN